MTKTITIESIGEVALVRTRRAKRASISIRPFRAVRVAVPYRSSFLKAEEFLRQNMAWVIKNVLSVRSVERDHESTLSSVEKIDSRHARQVLVKRLDHLALEHGFAYNKVSIRNQKTRWGSCSHANNISLNMNLIRLHDQLRDYVLLHELVHTRVKDHSRKFWSELDKYVGNAKLLDRQLKKHCLGMY
ncbi:MAG: M48 family metallopeptidase [Anaerohalosphaera sp.]|nr:M48 family metallopeptidase [Anaerohalosphaera sp.]